MSKYEALILSSKKYAKRQHPESFVSQSFMNSSDSSTDCSENLDENMSFVDEDSELEPATPHPIYCPRKNEENYHRSIKTLLLKLVQKVEAIENYLSINEKLC